MAEETQNARQCAKKQLKPKCLHSVAGNFAMKSDSDFPRCIFPDD